MRVSYDELHAAVVRALGNAGMEPDRADLCARIVAGFHARLESAARSLGVRHRPHS